MDRPFDNASLVTSGKRCTECSTVGKGKRFDSAHSGHQVERAGLIGQKYNNGRLTQNFHEIPSLGKRDENFTHGKEHND